MSTGEICFAMKAIYNQQKLQGHQSTFGLPRSGMIPFQPFLSLTIAFSQAGKSFYWRQLLSVDQYIQREDNAVYIFSVDKDLQYQSHDFPNSDESGEKERGKEPSISDDDDDDDSSGGGAEKNKDDDKGHGESENDLACRKKKRKRGRGIARAPKKSRKVEERLQGPSPTISNNSGPLPPYLGYSTAHPLSEKTEDAVKMSPDDDGTFSFAYTYLTYSSFDPEALPPNSCIILDELNVAVARDSSLATKVIELYARIAHHNSISVVALLQSVLGTPLFPLLSLSHFITIASHSGSNYHLIKNLPIFPPTKKKLYSKMAKLADTRFWVSIYYNVPLQGACLSNLMSVTVEPGVASVLYDLGDDSKGMRLKKRIEEPIKKLLRDDDGVAVVCRDALLHPGDSDDDSGHEEEGSDSSAKNGKAAQTTEGDAQSKELDIDSRVFQMIRHCVAPNQQFAYKRLWYYIRVEPRFNIDSTKLVLKARKGTASNGLLNFLHSLRDPSHLHSGGNKAKSKQSRVTAANVALAAVLASDVSFPAHFVLNKKLWKAAQNAASKN